MLHQARALSTTLPSAAVAWSTNKFPATTFSNDDIFSNQLQNNRQFVTYQWPMRLVSICTYRLSSPAGKRQCFQALWLELGPCPVIQRPTTEQFQPCDSHCAKPYCTHESLPWRQVSDYLRSNRHPKSAQMHGNMMVLLRLHVPLSIATAFPVVVVDNDDFLYANIINPK